MPGVPEQSMRVEAITDREKRVPPWIHRAKILRRCSEHLLQLDDDNSDLAEMERRKQWGQLLGDDAPWPSVVYRDAAS